ncbi:MAG: hypothetical protein DPW09_32995 [Anaerolineae bacterium]|nr:hypothetical protein [Anaerolineae bacterium]
MEARYQELKNEYGEGSNSPNWDIFDQQIQELQLEYNGEKWRLGPAGQWERETTDGNWHLATPPEEEKEENEPSEDISDLHNGGEFPSPDEEQEEQKVFPPLQPSKFPYLWGGIALAIVGLLIAAGIWFNSLTPPPPTEVVTDASSPTHITLVVTNTATATAHFTPTLAPTSTATFASTATGKPSPSPVVIVAPKPTLAPTATPTLPTPDTATPTYTPSPSPSLTPTPTKAQAPLTEPTLPARTGLIAYPAFNATTATYDLYLQRLETGEIIRKVEAASQPDLSPDGQFIVYRSWQLNQQGLIAEKLDGTGGWKPSNLFEAARPLWNATGDDLVFAVNNLKPDQWDVSFAGDRQGFSDGRTPAWFSDGRIIYQGSAGTNVGLVLANPRDGSLTFLTDSSRDTAPAPSIDNSKIAFVSDREGWWDLYLLDLATRQITRLTNDSARDTAPVWSPDGVYIGFVSDRGGNWAIWTTLPDGKNLQLLLNLSGSFDGEVAGIPKAQQTRWQTEHISWVK